MILLALVLTMAQPTHVYTITWDKRMVSDKEVVTALAPLHVILAKYTDAQKRKWEVAIESSKTRFSVRDQIKKLPNVARVSIKE